MLAMDKADGVSEVVCTPHYYGKKRSLEEFLTLRARAFAELGDTEIPLRLGAEVYMTGVNDLSDDALISLAIEGTKCVLLELPFHGDWKNSLLQRLITFFEDTGYTPVIAHVERYEYVRKNPKILTTLVQSGCLLQVNTSAFIEKDSERFVLTLLKRGMVHCIGTDTHDTQKRAPDYAKAKARVYKAGLEKQWNEAQAVAKKLLAGEQPTVQCAVVRKIFGVYF